MDSKFRATRPWCRARGRSRCPSSPGIGRTFFCLGLGMAPCPHLAGAGGSRPGVFDALATTNNNKETAMADNEWTPAEESMLVVAFRAGASPECIARTVRKTPGSVRWKLNRLGLTTLGCGPADEPKAHRHDQTLAARRGDRAFRRAMLAAIRRGAERIKAGTITGVAKQHYIPRVIPAIGCGYRSSAGYAADMGQGRHGP